MSLKTLYIGNLPYSTTETKLVSHFSTYGASNARVVEGRGFGFVDVPSDRAQEAITDKHESQLDGRSLTVNEAKPRENRSSSSSAGSNSGYQSRGGGSSRW